MTAISAIHVIALFKPRIGDRVKNVAPDFGMAGFVVVNSRRKHTHLSKTCLNVGLLSSDSQQAACALVHQCSLFHSHTFI